MADKNPPTYEELRLERAREWSHAQAVAGKQFEGEQARLLTIPDIMPPGSPWETPDVTCGCGGHRFNVGRWVTINGRRYRAELACLACRTSETWDFQEKRWL